MVISKSVQCKIKKRRFKNRLFYNNVLLEYPLIIVRRRKHFINIITFYQQDEH